MGLMSEAADVVTDFWFETLQKPLLRAPKATANTASRRLSENQGMRVIATGERDYVSGRLPMEVNRRLETEHFMVEFDCEAGSTNSYLEAYSIGTINDDRNKQISLLPQQTVRSTYVHRILFSGMSERSEFATSAGSPRSARRGSPDAEQLHYYFD